LSGLDLSGLRNLRQAWPADFFPIASLRLEKPLELLGFSAAATACPIWHLRCCVDFMAKELSERQPTQLEDQVQSQLNSFGARLRELRLKRGWTLEELACRSSLSKAFLSRLESGGRQASIAAALTLSRIFDVSLASLFESQLATEPCVIVRGANATKKSINGLKYVSLSHAGRFFNLQPIKVIVPVLRRGDEHYYHDGEEWVYVLSGALTLSLAGKTYDLKPGDAAHFDSRLPHRLIANGKKDVEVLLVASPVANSGQVMLPSISEHRAISPMRLLNFKPQNAMAGLGKPRQTKVNFKTNLKKTKSTGKRYE
jgi:transcriptional regulator with XRE-family HTH domain